MSTCTAIGPIDAFACSSLLGSRWLRGDESFSSLTLARPCYAAEAPDGEQKISSPSYNLI
jgi:hypothetical protein